MSNETSTKIEIVITVAPGTKPEDAKRMAADALATWRRLFRAGGAA